MVEIRKPITVPTAVERVIDGLQTLEIEEVSLETSDRRILAEDIVADHDVPPFDRSPYDGFAILAEDTKTASYDSPITLEVIETIGAGSVSKNKVTQGKAIRIMTGAALPEGANAIVMLELAKEDKEDSNKIIIKRPFYKGDNISWQGEDTKQGTVLLEKGQVITPGIKAVLATFGYAKVHVYRRPIIGVIATGSELLEVHESLVPGKIRNSNAHMVMAQINKAGGIPLYFGQLPDEFEASFQAVEQSLSKVDALITTGGVSVGDFDYLPAIYKKLGAEVLFNKVGMRPGSVTTVAKLGNKRLFGLSGNPSACFVGFELFAGPSLKIMMGHKSPHLEKQKAILGKDFLKPNPFTRFVRSKVIRTESGYRSNPVGLDKSNVVTSLALANALMILPGGTRGYKEGMVVDVLLLDGEGSSSTWE